MPKPQVVMAGAERHAVNWIWPPGAWVEPPSRGPDSADIRGFGQPAGAVGQTGMPGGFRRRRQSCCRRSVTGG